LNTAQELPKEAEEVKANAEGEFEGLDIMKKGKAIMNVGLNLKVLLKIP